MNIKGFVFYKEKEFIPCDLVISNSRIKEINLTDIKNTYPELHNSQRANITEIKEFHNPSIIQNGCKYYIQSSVNGELVNIFLDIGKIEYFKIKWGMKGYIVQSKEFIIGLSIGLILLILGLIFKT
tara:strand:- start:140 stop:517 length:378 start_codon:yes stop_codon:yes gene_type:complete